MSGEPRLTRRRLLVAGAGGLAAAGLGGGVLASRGGRAAAALPLPSLLPDRPERQHAWNARLVTDRYGNRTAPRHQRLLLFDLVEPRPTVDGARRLEGALRTLEARYPAGPAGLLLTLGWGRRWFAAAGVRPPIPPAAAMSDTELPVLEDFAACLHLASDDLPTLDAVDAALTRGRGLPGVRPGRLDVRGVLRLRGRRSGFAGAGLARRAARRLELPGGVAPPAGSPLMMGFQSGLRRNQATEDDVTIAAGPWAGSTTMHVSEIALTLPSWYRSLDDRARVAHMYAPQVTPAQVDDAGPGVTLPSASLAATARRYGVIGHAQAAATARRHGRPRILRRDFNGVSAGQPVTHFVSLQADIADFAATRAAMNADRAVGIGTVSAQINNGINEWLSVHRRANFLIPPRSRRTCPGLAGWDRT